MCGRIAEMVSDLDIYRAANLLIVRHGSPGLRLFDIKCAWFDHEEYSEFFPRTHGATRSR
jgi:hypothetical protein